MLLILRQALIGVRRYDDLRSALGVADNVLSRRLPAMVDAGLLRRVPYRGEQRSHHEYVLTEAGADLLPVLNALLLWGEKHTGGRRRPRTWASCTRPAAPSRPRRSLFRLRAPLQAKEVSWLRTWRAGDPQPLRGAEI